MACTATNCTTVYDGPQINGTWNVANYDPDAPVEHWHHRMELATICIVNSLTFVVIIARLWYRRVKQKRFRGDDKWMAVAGLFLIGTTVSQIGTNIFGGGLHAQNVPDSWNAKHWYYSIGWAGYYIVTSCIKLSVCFCFLELLPPYLNRLRYCVYGLCVFIASLGMTLTCSWLFECTPVLSNFVWSIPSNTCINHDMMRFIWIALSILVDLIILLIPLGFLRRLKLQDRERRILKMVFSATLLGTATCALEIYGVYEDRIAESLDSYYHEVIWIMLNDVEILMYAIGASFPVLSRYLVARNSGSGVSNENFSAWDRHIPNFFPTTPSCTGGLESEASHSNQPYVLGTFISAADSEQTHIVYKDVKDDFGIICHMAEGSQSSKETVANV